MPGTIRNEVGEAHQELIDPAAEEPGESTPSSVPSNVEMRGDAACRSAQRDLAALQHPGEEVTGRADEVPNQWDVLRAVGPEQDVLAGRPGTQYDVKHAIASTTSTISLNTARRCWKKRRRNNSTATERRARRRRRHPRRRWKVEEHRHDNRIRGRARCT